MKIWLSGGAGTMTVSKYLTEHAGRSVLFDCGLFQGCKNLRTAALIARADFIGVEFICGDRLHDPADVEGLIGAIPEVPVFLDSPMLVDATAIYRRFAGQPGSCVTCGEPDPAKVLRQRIAHELGWPSGTPMMTTAVDLSCTA